MPVREYHFKVAEQKDFVIVFPSMISVFLKDAKRARILRGNLKLEEILEKSRAEYLLRMINSNRNVYEGFFYRQIQEVPMSEIGLCCLLEEQLGNMEVDGSFCFEHVQLSLKEKKVQIVYSDSFVAASRDWKGEYLYIFSDRRKEKIFI